MADDLLDLEGMSKELAAKLAGNGSRPATTSPNWRWTMNWSK